MGAKGYWRGHLMEWVEDYGEEGAWLYSDTKTPVADNPERKCGHCNLNSTEEGHDGCLGTLPGVSNACCGHGDKDQAYVQYQDGTVLRKEKALKDFEQLIKITKDIKMPRNHKATNINGIYAECEVFQEYIDGETTGQWIARFPPLDVVVQGETRERAVENLKDNVIAVANLIAKRMLSYRGPDRHYTVGDDGKVKGGTGS